jgi:hypothetical protein
MKAKFGSFIVSGSGKIGGHIASRNRGGAYLKNKVTPLNPNTTAQQLARNRLKQFTQGWASLTAAQRNAWNACVTLWKTKDIFGDDNVPSGLNLYCRLNINLATVGAAAITSPPTLATVAAITSFSATVVGATGVVTLTFAPTVPAGVAMKIQATAPMSAGKKYVKNMYRFIKSVAAAQTSPQVLTTEYAAVHGTPSNVGMVVWFKMSYFNITTGQEGPAIYTSAIIS